MHSLKVPELGIQERHYYNKEGVTIHREKKKKRLNTVNGNVFLHFFCQL